jgi:hypothetical protein
MRFIRKGKCQIKEFGTKPVVLTLKNNREKCGKEEARRGTGIADTANISHYLTLDHITS